MQREEPFGLPPPRETLVVALGGNAILQPGQRGTAEEQRANVDQAMCAVASLVDQGFRIVLTHGNGPQIGTIMLQEAIAEEIEGIPAMPMDIEGAMSQGAIGYMIQQSLQNELARLGRRSAVVSMVTQTIVDAADPAFLNPTKPVGPFYTREKAESLQTRGLEMVEDSGRGFRRIVASPQPVAIREFDAIRALIDSGTHVICSGGGGIPVVQHADMLHGVEAVIDKDHSASLLARQLNADRLLILTDVEQVYIGFRTPEEQALRHLYPEQAQQFINDGHFAPGSMEPKVRAAMQFVQAGGREAITTRLDCALDALRGLAGTRCTSLPQELDHISTRQTSVPLAE